MAKQQIRTVSYNSTRWEPEPLVDSFWISKFTANLIKKGHSLRAENLTYKLAAEFKKEFPSKTLFLSLLKIFYDLKPAVGIGHRRLGLLRISIPYVIKPHVALKMAIRWITKAAQTTTNNRSERTLQARLVSVITPLIRSNTATTKFTQRQVFLTDVQSSERYKHFRWV